MIKMTKTVTNILKLSPTHFVSNIRHQHRCNRTSCFKQCCIRYAAQIFLLQSQVPFLCTSFVNTVQTLGMLKYKQKTETVFFYYFVSRSLRVVQTKSMSKLMSERVGSDMGRLVNEFQCKLIHVELSFKI